MAHVPAPRPLIAGSIERDDCGLSAKASSNGQDEGPLLAKLRGKEHLAGQIDAVIGRLLPSG
jgi:hypothetical protein